MAERAGDGGSQPDSEAHVEGRAELREYVNDLDEDETDFLSSRTRNVLTAHGDIQEEQRNQASRLLRAYAGGVGLITAGLGLASTVLRQIEFPSIENRTIDNPQVVTTLAVIFVTIFGGFLVFRAFLRFAGIIELVVQVLTPEEIQSESLVSRVFSKLPFYPGEKSTEDDLPFRSEAREGVRRVVEADDLESIAVHPELSRTRIVTEQLIRAQQNEVVINYNMVQLSHVYDIISKSLVDVLMGTFLVFTGLLLLSTI